MCGMEVAWLAGHWFDLIESAGVVGGLLFTAHTIRKDERARKISNLIALNKQHGRIWQEFYLRPGLTRVLKTDVDLNQDPILEEELVFVKMLVLHLDSVRRAMSLGMFVKIQGLKKDIQEFFRYPIPKKVWQTMRSFQDRDFVAFVENSLRAETSIGQ